VDRDPDPKGSEPFCRIRFRIRIIGSGPDPEPKGSKCKLYVVELDFSFLEKLILFVSSYELVEKRALVQKYHFYNGKNFGFQKI